VRVWWDRNGGQRKEGAVYIMRVGSTRASGRWRGVLALPDQKQTAAIFHHVTEASDCLRGSTLSGWVVDAMQNHGVL
jgi:hypothetical protein